MRARPCAHCGASPASESWDVRLCADGRKKRRAWLCLRCDVRLNATVARFMGLAVDLKAYARRKKAR